MKRVGQEKPPRLSVPLEEDVYAALTKAADAADVSRGKMAKWLVEEGLKRLERKGE